MILFLNFYVFILLHLVCCQDIITTIAGTGTASYSGDGGQATSATLDNPLGVALDSLGNVYIADFPNQRVRKVTISSGIITTIAGSGATGFGTGSYTGDGGQATSATLHHPFGVNIDVSGNLYICDNDNQRVRKVVLSTGIISTIAGGGTSINDGGTGTSSLLSEPWGVTTDSAGNVYISDAGYYRIRKVTVSTGIISTIAGSGSQGFSGDSGQATSASLNVPWGLVIDTTGNVYIADAYNHRVRKVTISTGIITTIAGCSTTFGEKLGSYSGDGGVASSAALNTPQGLALDSSGNIYIADSYNHRIRKVTLSTGIIATIAGSGTSGYSGDNGAATSAAIYYPVGITLDSSGNLYIADSGNVRIRKVTVSTTTPSRYPSVTPTMSPTITVAPSLYPSMSPNTAFIITTVAGSGSGSYSGDGGPATSAGMYPQGLALDSSGNVYIADLNNRIRKVTVATGIISTLAGSGTSGGYGGDNGQATSATLNSPRGVALDSSEAVMYIADLSNNRIRKVVLSTGIITTFAGTGSQGYTGDGGQATSATFYEPQDVVVDTAGNVYIAEYYNHVVRKITVSTGVITRFAGTGSRGYNGDNQQATAAKLCEPHGLAIDASGNIYIADSYNYRIRKVTVSTGIISTLAGTGSASYSGDNGAATSAALTEVLGVGVDAAGNVYIADADNQRVRKVTIASGIITTLAGTGSGSYSGDNGPASSAAVSTPCGIRIDSSGNVYIGDRGNARVRKVIVVSTATPSRCPSVTPTTSPTTSAPSLYPSMSPNTAFIITSVAGTGSGTLSGDGGAATSAGLYNPQGLALDSSGNIYIADQTNNRIRKVTVSTGIITTLAGSGTSAGYGGDNGQATSATLNSPRGVALDSSEAVMYIADCGNNRIRKITVSTGIITTFAGTGSQGYTGDGGQATSATFYEPQDVIVDTTDDVYTVEYYNHVVRKITVSTDVITRFAGTGSSGYNGDNQQATAAKLNQPVGMAIDTSGNIYIADSYNQRIRKVTVSTGIISTLAGTGSQSYSGDNGAATSAALNNVLGVGVDAAGNVYLSDAGNERVRKVTISSGIITTLAGTGSGTYSGDNGAATAAALYNPCGVRLDSSGNVYIGDRYNNRVRKVIVVSTATPSMKPTAPTLTPTVIPSMIPSITPTVLPSTMQPSVIPSMSPTTTPSAVPSTRVPSYGPSMSPSKAPTASPSTYPTYVASVRVYFLVTHVLSGVSASTYSSGKASNDRILKQTVVSVIGYDSKVGDISVLAVTDASSTVTDSSSTRSLASAVAGVTISYSVNTPTHVFNTTSHALAVFVHTLNESIVTGVFDALLAANAASAGITELQVLSTDYVIFSTTSPTSSPTSTPTSSPTKTDIIAANLLTVPLDAQVAKAKVKYYLGTFMGYFLAIYICLYLYSFLRYGKLTATKLYDSSHQSEVYLRISALTGSATVDSASVMSELYNRNRLVGDTMRLEEELASIKSHKSAKVIDDGYNSSAISATSELCESKYSKGYREYVQQQRTLLGCSPFLYPEGYVVKIPCTSREVVFPPGRIENILLYICHNHPLFSCFYFMDGSKLGAHGTRILYIGKDVAVFVLYQFSNMLLQYFMLDGYGLDKPINLFIITPSAVSIGLLLKYLYTCPFTETVEFQRRYANYQTVVLLLGRLAILPIMLIMFGSLLIACLFSSNRDVPVILINYFVFVQFYGVLFAIGNALLLFVDSYSYQLSICGLLDIICIGTLFKERILAEQLVVDVDYASRVSHYLCGLIRVEKILSRDDAIKAKWIVVNTMQQQDVEMKGTSSYVVGRSSATLFAMDTIYGSTNKEDGDSCVVDNTERRVLDEVYVATDNPIHSLATNNALTPASYHVTTVDESTLMEDDAALYLEYQNRQSEGNEAEYSMDNEELLSFEEWKNRRKKFKQGTRGSFVKAFQVFEEREQLTVAATIEQTSSASVKNTMKLHSNKMKNIIAATRAFGGAAANRPK